MNTTSSPFCWLAMSIARKCIAYYNCRRRQLFYQDTYTVFHIRLSSQGALCAFIECHDSSLAQHTRELLLHCNIISKTRKTCCKTDADECTRADQRENNNTLPIRPITWKSCKTCACLRRARCTESSHCRCCSRSSRWDCYNSSFHCYQSHVTQR